MSEETLACPLCRSDTIYTQICRVCVKCDWKEVPEEQLTQMYRNIIKNERNKERVRRDRVRQNEKVKRSYRLS